MNKGRKLTTSRSERYLGSLGRNQGHGSMIGGASELVEADVWSAVDDARNEDDRSENGEWPPRASAESTGGFGVYRNRRAGGDHRHVGGLSLAFDDSVNAPPQRIVHQYHRPQGSAAEPPIGRRLGTSVPVNVPDWSKIYRVDSVESMHDSDDGLDESEVVPPHEYLARSRRIAAHSVFEGVGRTLKGRDLSRVRDAVWSQTGFDG
ncbi:uncharacterized protein LOC127247733 [Andrographis paniculata]|uniref:uncharacterized protein LOC127247733 n=1 Tax=Andrographis paniculata TaxID=175694 RepID=UPI0021E8D3B8|nr:uncharacterized protein LOC127247733 [Andrographis paniculata]